MPKKAPAEKSIRVDLGASLEHPEERPTYTLADLSEARVLELAAGRVPRAIRVMCEDLLSWQDEIEHEARRPAKRKKSA